MAGRDSDAIDLGRGQHWVASRAQLLALGFSDEQIEQRLASGRWRLMHAGVYLLTPALPGFVQRVAAACLAGGPDAAASYRAAGVCWGLDAVPEVVEVSVPHGQRITARGVSTHRSRRLGPNDVVVRNGIRMTNIERTLADLGRFLSLPDVWKALDSAERKGLTTAARVLRYMDQHPVDLPGWRRMRRVLAQRGGGRASGSAAEAALDAGLAAWAAPASVRQHPIELLDGSIAVVDRCWPDARLVVEVDGAPSHGSADRAYDRRRQNQIERCGYAVLRYSASEVLARPVLIVREIVSTVAARTQAGRDLPAPVVAGRDSSVPGRTIAPTGP